MKQEATPTGLSSKVKDLPNDRARSVPPSSKVVRRSLVFGRPKSGEGLSVTQKGRDAEDHRVVPAGNGAARAAVNRVAEQLARPRRRPVDGVEEKWRKEIQDKVEMSENLIKNLECEVSVLRAELEKARSLNSELELKNRKLSGNLAAAEEKISAFSSHQLLKEKELNREHQSTKFKDIQKLIASKLENPKVMKEGPSEVSYNKANLRADSPTSPTATVSNNSPTCPSLLPPTPPPLPPPCSSLPPPPPPLPTSRPRARVGAPAQKAPAVVEFYQFLTKKEGKRDQSFQGNANKSFQSNASAHSSIVGEIQNRSAHLLAIRADIETKGEFINGLIRKIIAAAYTDIEDVLNFVDWLDHELSALADERAVLKHFNWPERKADAMREAAVEYRSLKLLETEISSFTDNPEIPCGTALKKMANLLDKSERSIQRLVKLQNSVLRSYQEHKIPTEWMLDSGIMKKIKQASMKLAKAYMKRVTLEFESVRRFDKAASQEALLLQGVHFAYRAHQFVGGLDSETMCALEEIKQRVPRHLGGSQGLLAGIPSS